MVYASGLPYSVYALELSGLGVHTESGKSLEPMIHLFQAETGYLHILYNEDSSIIAPFVCTTTMCISLSVMEIDALINTTRITSTYVYTTKWYGVCACEQSGEHSDYFVNTASW